MDVLTTEIFEFFSVYTWNFRNHVYIHVFYELLSSVSFIFCDPRYNDWRYIGRKNASQDYI